MSNQATLYSCSPGLLYLRLDMNGDRNRTFRRISPTNTIQYDVNRLYFIWADHSSPLSPLHQPDLLIRQRVQLINQGIDRGVGGGDLALEKGFLSWGFGIGKLLVKVEHMLD